MSGTRRKTARPPRAFPAEEILTQASLPVIEYIAEQMPGGFFIYRADGREELLFANSATVNIYGCETLDEFRELTGFTFPGMVHPEDVEAVEASIQDQIHREENRNYDTVEYRILRKDGTVRHLEDYGRYVHTENLGGLYYVFITDVTEKHAIAAEKLRAEMELERERRASETKSAFLFNVSHDIRTPMNAVMGFAALAERHMDDPVLLREYLEKVRQSGQHMLSLLDDLLEMNEIDGGGVRLNEGSADLRQEAETALDLVRPQAEAKQISLTAELSLPEGRVLLDAPRFRRILTNLLGNAVKFTPSGGAVKVTAEAGSASESGYTRYRFTVSDNGAGMTEDFMARMFRPFEREETSTRTGQTGTGLGLSIVKSLTDMMGGTVTVQSKKGEGSAFTVELPLRSVEAGAVPTEAAPPEPRADGERRILLAEDIELNRMLAETILEEAGFQVESVPDGCDAVEAVRRKPAGCYDLVLMDIQMPVMNGYEATRAIRAIGREDAKKLPIVALSANAREEDKRMSLDSGMDSHVAKPFDVANLIETINHFIALREET